ncbi:MAG: hypothetical protein ACO20J_03260, partial [Ilumatobacteraceae bacterium]
LPAPDIDRSGWNRQDTALGGVSEFPGFASVPDRGIRAPYGRTPRAAVAGYAIGQQAERSKISSAIRQVAIMLLAVGVTYVIGRLVGVSIN